MDQDTPKEQVVIGREIAAAVAAEGRHRAHVTEPSPLADVRYPDPGQADLLHVTSCSVDEIVGSLVNRFMALTPDGRGELRARLTLDDFYTLLLFSRRAAVLSLRSGTSGSARTGAFALALIDCERVDWRDLSWAAAIVAFAIERLGGDAPEVLTAAAEIATVETASVLEGFGLHPPADLADWGYREVDTRAGPGLAQTEGARYEPSVDLLAIAETVADKSPRDGWELHELTVAVTVPKVWFENDPPDGLGPALASVTGCVLLRGVAGSEIPHAKAQMMLVFVGEAPDSATADLIAKAAGPGSGSAFSGLGVAAGNVFAVLIARSVIQGRPSFETQESLVRFRPVLLGALQRANRGG